VLAALEKVVSGQTTVGDKTFPEFMQEARFDNTWRVGDELDTFLRETDQKFGELLTSEAMRSVNEDPFNPRAYPQAIGLLIGLTILGLAIQSFRAKAASSLSQTEAITPRAVLSFALILIALVSYVLLAETVGFVLMSVAILIVLSLWMGVRPWLAIAMSVLFSLAIYQLFAHGLRVPLPRGWLGW
jgi:putative tricarboxylic transport membrane protein